MIQLIFAALFFLGLHFGIAGSSLRVRSIEVLGAKGYRITFSTLSVLGLYWLAHAYRAAPYVETWGQLSGLKPVAAPLVLLAFLLVVLGVTTPNPTAVDGEKLLQEDGAAAGVLRITRHPFLWGVAIWAFSHLVVNGDLAALILFGSLLVLVVGGMFSIDAKRRQACGQHWSRYAEATSLWPFQAILAGRNRLVWREFKWWQLTLGVVLWAAVMHFHRAWFGVAPWG
ncbi:NnrU family protein [Methylococcus sp. EFPC2]|uniref:NnrU family protein n=1 Tax=Methylococcus sp. EFPC2 TaxID=2812648 RepID=UPI001967D50C|nr:NnrU family protein [Methylococcus sp. EFPC2]QSA96659.1 NnrU family protein [Methylococcus sp. EFPC2]